MKKKIAISFVIELILVGILYYFFLPALNPSSLGFWTFVGIALGLFVLVSSLVVYGTSTTIRITNKKEDVPFFLVVPICGIILIVVGIAIVNFICSPIFNARSYSERIVVDETGDFNKDIKEVNFNALPLLDRDSSEKLGDRVMGQMSEYVSQFYVSDQYTQINFNNEIIRVTPLEYSDLIKWIGNRKNGIQAYIKVNSVNGDTKLVKMDKGMKYMPSGYFNDNLARKLRFTYPTEIFGTEKFELDEDGKPYWVVPTYGYTGVGIKTRVTGVIILDPVTGESKKYKIDEVPVWVDNAYNSSLIIEQVNDWGTYKGGFLNSIFAQKNVVNTTTGYNYLTMNDDVYLYTGITSVLADESNLGFILSNMRTGETVYYGVAGAEEYSAMASAEGQVQQMKYTSTFPLLINLNGKATYLVSLKDAAGLVKMYGFVDVADYQKVVVTDASKGIKEAAQNYLASYAGEISSELLNTKKITVKKISQASIKGTTYYYIEDSESKKYKASIEISENLPFINNGDSIEIGYYESEGNITEIVKIN